MDFYKIREREGKKSIEVYPDFTVTRSKDLMIRGKAFYAIWDEEAGLWSTDEYDVQKFVDKELLEYRTKLQETSPFSIHVSYMNDFASRSWKEYRQYITHISDNSHQLDEHLTFANTEVKKKDYVSRRLPYSLEDGPCEAYDELMSVLYEPEEREKLEWAIGAVVAGEAKDIQKFIVLYGSAGTGKSTFLNIVEKLFPGYYVAFEAKTITSFDNQFAAEVFRNNPMIAIQHDADLSRIEDNTKLNSIIAHEPITMNEKFKSTYMFRPSCFMFVATNKPVKITDAKSGIIRRLIDVNPTGKKVPVSKYHSLMSRIDFELGAIAHRCLDVYRKMGKNYYSDYKPLSMIYKTDIFFNFVEEYKDIFLKQGGVTLSQAWSMYKTYCEESLVEYKLAKHKFREELENYFDSFFPRTRIDGKEVRNYYSGLIASKFTVGEKIEDQSRPSWLTMDSTESIFDEVAKDFPAQYASTRYETPSKPWTSVNSTLKEINTKRLHYVKLPSNHIVIDFDLEDDSGKKSPERSMEAASNWPPTYAEYSKSGCGIHLHYIYDGDSSKLNNLYSPGIEIKVCNGNAAIRRKLSKCNTVPISSVSTGLPLKGEKVINFDAVKSEKGLRDLIRRNLQKEFHPGTKPSVDFINKILEEAYTSGMNYDVTDMRPKILAFANNSTHQSPYCVELVGKMRFKSEDPSPDAGTYRSDALVFFDVEVFPNLFLLSWKYTGKESKCVHLINPTSEDIRVFFDMKLVGFNCRRYDNHILYARYIGYDLNELYTLNTRIIGESKNSLFSEAYNISYADVYDFSAIKQSLKKFEIELGIHHLELGLPYDQPIQDEDIPRVIEYCDNDVIATEAVFDARHQDFVARQILADLSGLKVNDTTQTHTARIIFGNDPKPQEKFIYTDLKEIFNGYEYRNGKSTYRDELVGEGGYVYAEPGFYENVALLDIASMHPTSIEVLNLFGPYTARFSEIKAARLAIKHKDFNAARSMLGGCLERYLESTEGAADLAYALKIIIVSVYGFTSAKFPNKFKDPRNVDNIVAKRGALFMIDLKHAVQEQGFVVAHIKTDSIKIPNATRKIIKFVFDFGKKYGYEFEEEANFDSFCLVNDAVYIARYKDQASKRWVAVGAQFAQPYVYKTLFSKEDIVFEDLCETKTVTSALYLDMNEDLGEEHNYVFVGKAGSFCPIKSGAGGGLLMREKDGKYYAATGTKGYRWLEAELVKELGKEKDVDIRYHDLLVEEAVETIAKFVDPEKFFS